MDYDVDGDGLIEVSSLAQLNAIRWDLDGDGAADVYPPDHFGDRAHDPDGASRLAAAFPHAEAAMGCPSSGCVGYELAADLDFDTDGSGTADSGDEFWNGGKGWVPLMGGEAIYDNHAFRRFQGIGPGGYFGERAHLRARMFTGVFEGNGRTISNLYINDGARFYVGLFGYIGPGAHVRNLGLTKTNSDSGVTGREAVGALAGELERGRVSGVYSHLDVTGHSKVGGLVGANWRHGFIVESYATGDVSGYLVGGLVGMLNAGVAASYATGDVTGRNGEVGGLVGYWVFGRIRATYATGSVTVTGNVDAHVGGLVGRAAHCSGEHWPRLRANYATGAPSGPEGAIVGGFTGGCISGSGENDAADVSYWDVDAAGTSTNPTVGVGDISRVFGQGYTTAQLQAPTGYTGIYAGWNVDVDIEDHDDGPFDGPGDDPWDFGTTNQYPVLKYCAAKPGIDTADGQPYCPLQPSNQRSSSLVVPDSDGGSATDSDDDDGLNAGGDDGGQTGGATLLPADDPQVRYAALIEWIRTDRIADHADDSAHVQWKRVLKALGDPDYADYGESAMTAAQARARYENSPWRASWTTWDASWEEIWDAIAYAESYTTPADELPVTTHSAQQQPTADGLQQLAPPAVPEITITAGAGVTEGSAASFTVSASPAPAAALTVQVSVSAGGDFGAVTGARDVVVPTSGSVSFTVPTTGDRTDEFDGSVTATVQAGTGYTVGASGSASVRVADDDDPLVTISASAGVVEGTAASFTLTATLAPQAALSVSVHVTALGDFGAVTGVRDVVVPTSGSVSFTVPTTGDDVDEPDGSVTATVQSGTGYTVGAPASVTVSVADDDLPPPGTDYDVDHDGLIEVSSLAQLNAIRWDLDGDGTADVYPPHSNGSTGHDPDGASKLAAAFPDAQPAMGCPPSGCAGYELAADLDFDTNGSGTADAGDEFWNGGKGWVPLMGGEAIYTHQAQDRLEDQVGIKFLGDRPNSRARMFTGVFEGNGRTIANLYIDDSARFYVGLFGYVGPGAHVRNFGLTKTNSDSGVRGGWDTGALAGDVERARVSGVYSHLDVSGHSNVGGLVGGTWRFGFVIESYATGDVSGVGDEVGGLVGMLNYSGVAASYATGDVSTSSGDAGGLVGYWPDGRIRATYASGSVTLQSAHWSNGGGLVGKGAHCGGPRWPRLRANYATGAISVPAGAIRGGLTGGCYGSSTPVVAASYWDTEASGVSTSPDIGAGYTTAQLQAPTGYAGIYADWNVDVDVGSYWGPFDGPGDDPWDFGTSTQYPVLKYCAAKPGIDTADGQPYCPLSPANQRRSPLVVPESDDSSTVEGDEDGLTTDGDDPAVLPAGYPLVRYAALIEWVRTDRVADHSDDSAHVQWKRVLKALGDPDYADYPESAMTSSQARARYENSPWRSSWTTWDSSWDEIWEAIAYAEGYTPVNPPPAADPVVTISGGGAITEGGSASFTITASPVPASAIAVNVGVTQDGDWGANGPATVTVSGATTAYTITTSGDEVDEADGSVTAAIESGTGYTVGSASSASVNVADDDDPPPVVVPEVTIAAGAGVTEGTAASFTLTASPAPAAPLTVDVDVTAAGDFGATTGTRSVTVPVSGTVSFTVPTTGDSADEADGSVTATVQAGSGYTVGPAASGTVTVSDDDDPPPVVVPEVTIAAGAGVIEGTAASFALTASPAPAAPLTVDVVIAAAGDYGATTGTRSVTVPASGTVSFTVPTTGDSADEADGSVTATVQAGSGYTVGTAAAGRVSIADDDDPPAGNAATLTVAAGVLEVLDSQSGYTDPSVGRPGMPLRFTVTAGDTAGQDVIVGYTFAARGVSPYLDYCLAPPDASPVGFRCAALPYDPAQPTGTVTIAKGATTAEIVVVIDPDAWIRGDAQIDLILTSVTGAKAATARIATGNIRR